MIKVILNLFIMSLCYSVACFFLALYTTNVSATVITPQQLDTPTFGAPQSSSSSGLFSVDFTSLPFCFFSFQFEDVKLMSKFYLYFFEVNASPIHFAMTAQAPPPSLAPPPPPPSQPAVIPNQNLTIYEQTPFC